MYIVIVIVMDLHNKLIIWLLFLLWLYVVWAPHVSETSVYPLGNAIIIISLIWITSDSVDKSLQQMNNKISYYSNTYW